MLDRLSLYFNTVRHMLPGQVCSMIARPYLLKRACRPKKGGFNAIKGRIRDIDILIPEIDECGEFLSRFDYGELKDNKFTFLHETHMVNLEEWKADASPLWNFNLHYFEYAIYLGYLWKQTGQDKYYNKYRELVEKWIEVNKPENVSWHPYPLSLRLINLLVSLGMFGDMVKKDDAFNQELLLNMYLQYRTLILRQEVWLLGNHYFENLFSIVVASYFFHEDHIFRKYLKKLEAEAARQILGDGMHFELSPMYHKVILADLLRLKQLAMNPDFPKSDWIDRVIKKMLSAMRMLEEGFDRTPLFNDSGDNVAHPVSSIEKACQRMNLDSRKISQLKSAGYYKLGNGKVSVLVDAGIIGPPYMPGHGHCDCLSFEMAIGGKAVFVNSGTFQYQGGRRRYFRSTKAHNTIMMDGQEQSQFWGEHRVARRIRVLNADVDGSSFSGEYKNYSGKKHKRTVNLFDRKLIVMDAVKGAAEIKSYLHISSDYMVTDNLEVLDGDKKVAVICPSGCNAEIYRTGELSYYSPEFGELHSGTCVVFSWRHDNAEKHGYIISY